LALSRAFRSVGIIFRSPDGIKMERRILNSF